MRSFGASGENVAQPDPESAAEATLPPVELYRVRDYDGVAHAETRPPLLVSGDGDAWPGLAAFDVLAESGPVRYSGDASTAELERLLEAGSPVVISDSNRRRVREIPLFDTIARSSYTLAADQELRRPAQDLFDAAGSETVAHFPDAVQIEASSYGRPPVPQAYYRPSNAFDGDPRTSWRVSPAFVNEDEQWIRVDLREPTDVTDVDLVAAQTQPTELSPDPMHVTRATVVLSDGTERSVELVDGQGRAHFDAHPTDSVEVRIEGVGGTDPRPFGFSEITVDELDLRETIQLPDDLIRKAHDSPGLRSLLERGRRRRTTSHASSSSTTTRSSRPSTAASGRSANGRTPSADASRAIRLRILRRAATSGSRSTERPCSSVATPPRPPASSVAKRWRSVADGTRSAPNGSPPSAGSRSQPARRKSTPMLPAVPVVPMSWTSGRPTSRSTRPSTRPA